MSLFVATGNGHPGIYDTAGSESAEVDGLIESFIYDMNMDFTAALSAGGVAYTKYFYGNGTHSWGYWLRDLAHFLPQMWSVFTHPSNISTTAPFTYRTVDTTFDTHGYRFSISHQAEVFTYIDSTGPQGMSVVGAGPLSVETPAVYVPNHSYRVTINGVSTLVRADQGGRLTYSVNLGDAGALQQYEFTSNDPDGLPSAQVSIAAINDVAR